MAELENLSKKIIEDALKEAEEIKNEAKAQAKSIVNKSRESANDLLDEAKKISETLYKQAYAKRISQNDSLRRQQILRKKMEMVEQVLKKVRDEAVKLPKDEYREYFKKNASQINITEGEFLIGSKEEHIDAAFIKQIFKPAKIQESKDPADFEYGIKIISGRTHYTLSLLTDIEYGREKMLSLINSELFKGENN
ncbi:MAG: V-type ATP synthase subunit E [bacterium]